MAEVFRAHPRTEPDRTVVIKRILSRYRNDVDHRVLLLREAEIGKRLQHPNIVRVFGAGNATDDEPYIIMEYVDGIDLKRLAWSFQQHGLEFPPWLAVHLASEALAGVAHAHAQTTPSGEPAPVLHQDISPENLLVSRRGRIKIADFGVAAVAQPTGLPRGKLPYMSPERFAASSPLDPRIDVFAVGVMLWELLTGRHLFRGRTPNEVVAQVCAQPRIAPSRLKPTIPHSLDQLVVSALSADPSQRPASALAMHAALQRALEVLRPEGLVTTEHVAAIVDPHLAYARVPNAAITENALGDIEEVLGLDDDALFAEPSDEMADATPETTYAIIRRPSPSASTDEGRLTTDELLKAYLDEPPIPATPGLVDTLDLAPGAVRSAQGPISSPSAYMGPFPVWVSTPHGYQGPLKPSRAFSYVRDQPADTYAEIRLSANGSRWVTLDRLAYLLDDELVQPTLSLDSCEMQGRIGPASITAIMGTFAMGRTTNRAMFVRTESSAVERFELQFVDGQIAAIHHNELLLELWSRLLEDAQPDGLGLVGAFHATLNEDRRLAPRLSATARAAWMQARSMTKRTALKQLFSWADGQFGSNAKVLAQPDASCTDVLRLLPRLVAGEVEQGVIHSRITPYLKRRLWRTPTFETEVQRLQLRSGERTRAEAFGLGRTLFESLEYAMAGEDDARFAQVLAYLLLELGLLQESNPSYARTAR